MATKIKLHEFIQKRPSLVWYVKDYDQLNDTSIVEHTLNYGTWEDFIELNKILGVEKIARIFRANAFQRRTNYRKSTRQYFRRYFDAHAK